jgi:hypothetical protein
MTAVGGMMGERAGGDDEGTISRGWGGLAMGAKVGSGRTSGVILEPLRGTEWMVSSACGDWIMERWNAKRSPFHQLVLDLESIPTTIILDRLHIRDSTHLTIEFRLTDTYHMIQFPETSFTLMRGMAGKDKVVHVKAVCVLASEMHGQQHTAFASLW